MIMKDATAALVGTNSYSDRIFAVHDADVTGGRYDDDVLLQNLLLLLMYLWVPVCPTLLDHDDRF